MAESRKFTFYHTGEANVRLKDQLLGFRDSLKEYGHECEELTKGMGLGMSRQEICSLYMIFGGVAYYWGFLRKGESVAQNVDRLLFAENGKLRGEFDSMLSSLFRRDAGCRKMFTALSSKGIGISRDELLSKTGMSDGKVFCQTLDALEKCGFVRRYTAFGKKQRDSLYQLIDCFSLFHLKFIEPESNPDPQSWTTGISSREKDVWAGLAFERVCLLHVGQLKRALGIGGVRTGVCSWRHVADDVYPRGAQIDLLIDRADNVVNVCEMKFASGDYVLTKAESENIDNKVLAFKTVTETPKSVYLTLVTTNGLVDNEYARKFQNVLFLDSLFSSCG